MPCPLYTFKNSNEWDSLLDKLSARNVSASSDITKKVLDILEDVKSRGDLALLEYTRLFDAPNMQAPIRVDKKHIEEAAKAIPQEAYESIALAAKQIRTFHEAQKEKSWFLTQEDGTILGQRISPVDSAGLYVPGGQGGNTPLVSSLLMCAIPALVAGVSQIRIVTPPREDGSVNPYILAAAHILDCDEIYAVGSAWAIAALAFGTESIASVDVIAGPGNIFVSTAKHLVQGHVAIDMIAGPSEILVLADEGANAAYIAADMLSQAEHDTLASSLCVTPSAKLAEEVQKELTKQLATLPRAEIAATSLGDYGAIVLVPNMEEAIEFSNKVAPEHLEVLTEKPWDIMPRLRHAGAIFLGPYSPEPLGDYFAGPNHVLPTCGTARFASGLSVQTFCKRTSIIAASEAFTKACGPHVARLARMENLEAHALSMEARLQK